MTRSADASTGGARRWLAVDVQLDWKARIADLRDERVELREAS